LIIGVLEEQTHLATQWREIVLDAAWLAQQFDAAGLMFQETESGEQQSAFARTNAAANGKTLAFMQRKSSVSQDWPSRACYGDILHA
jgi:hypothetical protein